MIDPHFSREIALRKAPIGRLAFLGFTFAVCAKFALIFFGGSLARC
jgi:hypothetical protein